MVHCAIKLILSFQMQGFTVITFTFEKTVIYCTVLVIRFTQSILTVFTYGLFNIAIRCL